MTTTIPAPTLDFDAAEEGWTLVDDRESVRFELPTMRVLAHTLVFEDEALRAQVDDATGNDQTWRFAFASRLTFDPPLPPLTGTASVYGSVRSSSREAFVDDLRERGVDNIDRGRTERLRTETGDRVSLTRYRGRFQGGDAQGDVPVAALLGVWTHDGTFRLAGGAYPDQSLSVALEDGPETDPTAHRDALVEFIRGTR